MSATGELAEKCPECLGEFAFDYFSRRSGKPVYKNGYGEILMYFSGSETWAVLLDSTGFQSAVTEVGCPVDITRWNYHEYGDAFSNPGSEAPMTVTCT